MRPRRDDEAVSAHAFARAGLLGNPSDGYGGKAIAFTLPGFSATVQLRPAERFVLVAGSTDGLAFDSVRDASVAWRAGACEDGLRLVRAAVARFARHWPGIDALSSDDPLARFELSYATDIPRQVGLAGSSAIVIATLRALGEWFDVPLAPFTLAELALAAEVEELGIAAGAMDRVVQAYEGFMLMDLREPRSELSYERLDPTGLPPLFVAWDRRGGESSGRAHGDLRARWRAGDPDVVRAIEAFRQRVDDGVEALRRGDHAALRALVDANFDARREIFDVGPRDLEMVAMARERGAAAKLCGSGGAILGLPAEGVDMLALERDFHEAGFAIDVPRLGGAGAEAS